MHRRTAHYAISQLLSQALESSTLRPGTFIRALGYQNINSGLRALDSWLQTGQGDPLCLARLTEALALSGAHVEEALRHTARRHEIEEKETERKLRTALKAQFRPYIEIESTARRPAQITFFALTGGQTKRIAMPQEAAALPLRRQLRWAAVAARRHFSRYRGQIPLFGPVKAYRFWRKWDESYLFDTGGVLIARELGEPQRFASAELSVGKKRLTCTLLPARS